MTWLHLLFLLSLVGVVVSIGWLAWVFDRA